jgi:hypothetical protein
MRTAQTPLLRVVDAYRERFAILNSPNTNMFREGQMDRPSPLGGAPGRSATSLVARRPPPISVPSST